jgi:hypothetical protein
MAGSVILYLSSLDPRTITWCKLPGTSNLAPLAIPLRYHS